MKDLGVSAFNARNLSEGQFGEFIRRVESGEIERGSYLLVESFDRLSRDEPLKALRPFLTLLEAGIVVVTLLDRQVYSEESLENNHLGLLMSLTYMGRAHDESATKSSRLSARRGRRRGLASASANSPAGARRGFGCRKRATHL